jgi:transposase
MESGEGSKEVYVGLDVAERTLSVSILPSRESSVIENTPEGLEVLGKRLKALSPRIVLLEGSGGLQAPVALALSLAGLPVVVVNPRQVRDFAKAMGYLAKTDRLDALVIAEFASRIKPEPRALADEDTLALNELLTRRRQLVDMRKAEEQRLQRMEARRIGLRVRNDVVAHIRYLSAGIEKLDGEMQQMVKRSPLWQGKLDLLLSVPAIGQKVAQTLLAQLPELGSLSSRAIASLVGLAPFNDDTGVRRGRRRIRGGRAEVRRMLYLSAMVGVRYNVILKRTYERLLSLGKPKKVALIACAHKLLTIINAMLRDQRSWSPGLAS